MLLKLSTLCCQPQFMQFTSVSPENFVSWHKRKASLISMLVLDLGQSVYFRGYSRWAIAIENSHHSWMVVTLIKLENPDQNTDVSPKEKLNLLAAVQVFSVDIRSCIASRRSTAFVPVEFRRAARLLSRFMSFPAWSPTFWHITWKCFFGINTNMLIRAGSSRFI